ncbi:unnamed protein product [Cuscuta campestris]|uniref:VOC domain-containing protein n=1 Tax=Cuscuta campestris TaxID=132261 RepID=A0A484ME12_9ASTE|nr:unnamed protein product [Cuscuta campestris]
MEMKFLRQRVEEGGVYVDQLFFHDPDGFMIEICNCDNLPVVPLAGDLRSSCSRHSIPNMQSQQTQQHRRHHHIHV